MTPSDTSEDVRRPRRRQTSPSSPSKTKYAQDIGMTPKEIGVTQKAIDALANSHKAPPKPTKACRVVGKLDDGVYIWVPHNIPPGAIRHKSPCSRCAILRKTKEFWCFSRAGERGCMKCKYDGQSCTVKHDGNSLRLKGEQHLAEAGRSYSNVERSRGTKRFRESNDVDRYCATPTFGPSGSGAVDEPSRRIYREDGKCTSCCTSNSY